MTNLKWAIPFIPLFFLLAACEKELSSVNSNELKAMPEGVATQPNGNAVAATEEDNAAMSFACGTPSFVSSQWYWSNGCNCNVKFKCGAVVNATLYTWEIHQVFSWGVDPIPFFVKNTTTNSWNWGGGYGQPDNFQVWVKAKCDSGGYGLFKKSVTIVPPLCCSQQ